jgi:2-polyprenyl-3-methyl-5-hydroxy-6-metoxy-1,4-benzoquinol methylase
VSRELPDIRFQTKWLSRNPLVRRANSGFRETLLRLVHACDARTILDAGCGEGINLLTLSKAGDWQLEGLELTRDSLDLARAALPDRVALRQGDVTQLPYDDRSFDLVLGTEVLEHVDDPARALREMARVSRGRLVLSVPREPLWRVLNVMRGKYLRHLGNTDGHLNHWSGRGFRRFCAEEVDVLAHHHPIPWTFLLCAPRHGEAGER